MLVHVMSIRIRALAVTAGLALGLPPESCKVPPPPT
jgi:hypothetical protein